MQAFKGIFSGAVEMFDIAARCAEAEAGDEDCRELILGELVELAKACKGLAVEAKKRVEAGA